VKLAQTIEEVASLYHALPTLTEKARVGLKEHKNFIE
jgi:hypothetical protein